MTVLEAFRTIMGDENLVARPVGGTEYAIGYCQSSAPHQSILESYNLIFRKLKFNSGWQSWRTTAGVPSIPIEDVRKDWEVIPREELPTP